MFSESVVLDLIGRIYDAAESPAMWQAFLARLVDVLHGTAASLDLFDYQNHAGGVAAAFGLSEASINAYVQHYAQSNILWPRMEAAGLVASGSVVDNRMVVDDAEFARTEYANDFFGAIGVFHAGGGTIFHDDRLSSNVSVLRPRSLPFQEDERRLFSLLMPHLQRSLSIHRQLCEAESSGALLGDALDRLRAAAIIVDDRGHVLRVNTAAQLILQRNDGLSATHDGLQAASSSESKTLRRLIADAGQTAVGKGVKSGGVILLTRPSAKRPYVVTVAPLRTVDIPNIDQRSGVAVFIADPEQRPAATPDLLRVVHGLTPAESRLAMLLMEGQTIKEAAEKLAITVTTARQHLKSILFKTSTRRQSELVLLLSATTQQLPDMET